MNKITQHLLDDIRALKLKKFYQEPVCMKPISKNLRGEFDVVERRRQECDEPECVTRKAKVRFRTSVKPHQPCDSRPSQALNGDIEGELVFSYIRNGLRRGCHVGHFRWDGVDSEAVGRMEGMTNIGTHRRPVAHCENCHEPGHMEGCMDAVIVKGKHKGCRIKATYLINFDPAPRIQDTAFVGTIEAVLICECEHQHHHDQHDHDDDDDDDDHD
ncbi:MAG: hypothetical protein ACR2Q4_15025 [Geminicoccaceae bacterium]